ncbi:MAG TPA: c-type cytochrome [candidate division Zixibacteria bacterium]|nr:c-type cytochrome [candidate division Zixibacteria bacterium]
MAERGIDPQEEKKSYGSVFVLGVAMLVALSFWAFWDDNITRRPWKAFQARFYRLDYAKAKAAYDEEDKKLRAEPKYQELSRKLAAARASLSRGQMAERLAALERQEKEADVRFREIDQEVKFIKSELEEAWYEHDHAVQQRRNPKPYLEVIRELEKEQQKLEPQLAAARAKRERIKEEIKKIHAGVKELEDELAKLSAERDKWRRVMENATFQLGPVSFYRIPKILQVSLDEFDRNRFDQPIARVDRCQTCHLAINRPGFEDQPNPFKTHPKRETLLGDNAHPPEKFGCTSCHEGQGVAVNSVKQAHGEVPLWEFPLLRGAKAQSSCVSCHLDVQKFEQEAPLLAQGQRIFEQIGCTGCHLVKGYENIPKIGPSLRRISAKVDPSWMVGWIENPHKFRRRTRMPNFDLKRDEAVAIAAFLWSLSKDDGESWLQQHPLPAAFREGDAAAAARGKKLVETVGCKGCHGFAEGEFTTVVGKEKDLVPNLKDIASKTNPRWIYHWIKNPKDFAPDTAMPSLRLTDDEALAITSYLATLGSKAEPIPGIEQQLSDARNIKRGESLVRKYGCFGCHDIEGMEKESRIGVELTTFGSKPLEELFFGNRTDIKPTWDDWTYNKLKTPRIYATERVEQVMPQFNLADEDIRALRILLAGFREKKVGERYLADQSQRVVQVVEGRRLVQLYNCVGCHEIEKRGGFVKKYYEAPEAAPPPLNGEGEKVQSNWLFGFLKSPVPLRPWLQIRMPTFGFTDPQANLLVSYFNGLSKVEIPFAWVDDTKIPRENLEAARVLASRDYFNCFSCHQQGGKTPEGPPEGWAPDLALARQRLNPAWILKWLQDPQKIQPGTKMPSFYPGGPDNILGGKDDRQIEALRDYVMTLGGNGSRPAAPAAPGARAAARR